MYNNFSSKKTKKVISALLASALVVTSAPITADAATSKVLGVKKTFTVAGTKVTGLSKAEKKVVKVTIKNKKVTVKGLKAGKVSFKIGKKAYNVKVGATKVKASAAATSLKVNATTKLSIVASNGKNDKLTVKTSNDSIVKISKSSVTANASGKASITLKGLAAGTSKITVTSKNTGKTASVKIKVVADEVVTQAPVVSDSPVVSGNPSESQAPAVSGEPSTSQAPAPSFDPVTAKEGTLTVTTNVSGASIKVISGGATVASVAMNPLEKSITTPTLKPGVYEVEVSKKRYDTYKTTITVDGNVSINAELAESVVLGASATVTNSLIEYENTVLVNDNAIVTVTVKDKNGNLVPGKTVVFSANKIDNGAAIEVKGQNVQTTDANGRASFVVGLVDTTSDSTDTTKVTSAEFTAKVLDVTDGTNSIASGCVGFAALDLASVDVYGKKLEVGKNAGVAYTNTDYNGIAKTYSLKKMVNEDPNVEYISTQKVSSEGKDEHEVTFNVNPKISLPKMTSTDTVMKDFIQPVNEKSGAYFTYATNEYDKIIVLEEDTSKLQYATLKFNNIQISKYTKMVITSYTGEECKATQLIAGSRVEIDGEYSQKDFGYQIPLNENAVKAIKVSLKSAGQVETDMNSGYDIKEIVGVYNSSSNTVAANTKAISTAKVSWETVNPTMSNFATLDPKAPKYAKLKITPKADKNTFDYQVPVFPYTGDAVIREFDSNKKVVAYYLVPTVKDNKNTNIINTDIPAYEATAEEATNHSVGTIKTNGNNVVVNSTAVGATNLKGTITLPSLGADVLDASNKNVYTSVQWNPLPKDADVSTSDAFLALAGQNVTVYAQLSDKNGNPVSLANQTITYTLNNTEESATTTFESNTDIKTLNGTAVVKNTNTDVNGRATLTLNNAQAAVIDDLKATAGNYDVILYIGKEKATTADIYWVNADLAFKKSVSDADYLRTNNDTATIDTDKPVVSTPWQYAVKTVGNIFEDKADTHVESYYKKFKDPGTLEGFDISIDGLKINTTFDEDNKGKYKVSGNGVVDATSSFEYKDTIINELNGTSVGTNVTFTAKKGDVTKTYECVGEGNANLQAKMKLNVSWEAQGSMLSITSPAGTTISLNAAGGTGSVEGKGGPGTHFYGYTDLYVKVTDATGKNPKEGTRVWFKSGTDKDRFSDGNGSITTWAKTDGNGVAHVVLNVADATQKSSVVTASVDGVDEVATTTINWVNYEKAFGLVNAGLSSDNAKQIVLTFNNNVEASSVKKDMFEVKNNGSTTGDNYGKKYEITDAKASGKYVYLTLKNTIPTDTYTVSIAPTTVDSVKYTLSDEKGVAVTKTTADFYSDKTGNFNAVVSYAADNATVTVSNIKTGIELTDLNNSNAGTPGTEDVKAYAEKYFVVTVDGKIQTLTATTVGSTFTTAGMSFKFDVPQTGADQKVAIYYLGGSETYTVKAAEDLAQVGAYQVNSASHSVTVNFNRNINYAAGKTSADLIAKKANNTDNATVSTVDGSSNSVTFTFTSLDGTEIITIPAGVFTDSMGYTNEEIKITSVDITAPKIKSAKIGDATTKLVVTFDEAVDKTLATTSSNWSLTGGSTTITGVTLSDDGKIATLTFSSAIDNTSIDANAIKDIHGNALDAAADVITIGTVTVGTAQTIG